MATTSKPVNHVYQNKYIIMFVDYKSPFYKTKLTPISKRIRIPNPGKEFGFVIVAAPFLNLFPQLL